MIIRMRRGRLEGRSMSYKAFQVKGRRDDDSTDCCLIRVRVSSVVLHESAFLSVELVGNRFLRHMVRAIVVTIFPFFKRK